MRRAAAAKPPSTRSGRPPAPRRAPTRRAQRNHYPSASPTPPWTVAEPPRSGPRWSGGDGLLRSCGLSVCPSRSKGYGRVTFLHPGSWTFPAAAPPLRSPHHTVHGARTRRRPPRPPLARGLARTACASTCTCSRQQKTVRCHGNAPGKKNAQTNKIEDSDLPGLIFPPPSSRPPNSQVAKPQPAFSSPPSAWDFHVNLPVRRPARAPRA